MNKVCHLGMDEREDTHMMLTVACNGASAYRECRTLVSPVRWRRTGRSTIRRRLRGIGRCRSWVGVVPVIRLISLGKAPSIIGSSGCSANLKRR